MQILEDHARYAEIFKSPQGLKEYIQKGRNILSKLKPVTGNLKYLGGIIGIAEGDWMLGIIGYLGGAALNKLTPKEAKRLIYIIKDPPEPAYLKNQAKAKDTKRRS